MNQGRTKQDNDAAAYGFAVAMLGAVALIIVCGIARASDPISDALKKGAAEEKKLKDKIEKYKIKERAGERIIGVSDPYYIIDGKRVYCDQVEWVCADGKCRPVPKK